MTWRRYCPYGGCGWSYDEPDIIDLTESRAPNGDLIVRIPWLETEQAIRDHLDTTHPGWTLAEVMMWHRDWGSKQ